MQQMAVSTHQFGEAGRSSWLEATQCTAVDVHCIMLQQHFLTRTADLQCNTLHGMCRNVEVIQLKNFRAKGKDCLVARLSGENILNIAYT